MTFVRCIENIVTDKRRCIYRHAHKETCWMTYWIIHPENALKIGSESINPDHFQVWRWSHLWKLRNSAARFILLPAAICNASTNVRRATGPLLIAIMGDKRRTTRRSKNRRLPSSPCQTSNWCKVNGGKLMEVPLLNSIFINPGLTRQSKAPRPHGVALLSHRSLSPH